jgi:hypothetical protein
MEYDIVSKQLTGVTYLVPPIGGSSSQTAAGAFFATDMVPGYVVLGGTTQGSPNMAFAMDMGSSAAWINIDLEAGSLNPGENETMSVTVDATDLLPAVYEAEIIFVTDPNMGNITVPVQLTVEGLIPPIGLFAYYICTDVHLMWDIPGGIPDSYNIYRNGEILANITALTYVDVLVNPMIEYCYSVTAVYGSEESQPSAVSCLTVPLPANLGVLNADGWGSGDAAYIVWEAPVACVAANEYNVYRNSVLMGSTVDTFYIDPDLSNDLYLYYVTAVYYFGESGNSSAVPILITSFDENKENGILVSPNPASGYVMVKSGIHVNSYSLIDMRGKLIETRIVESSSFTINVTPYSEGVYYLRFETDKRIILRKIILQ